MDTDLALYMLDLFARDQSVDVHQVRRAANLLSHYLQFLELYADEEAVLLSRNNLRLMDDQRPQPGDFLAVVTLGGSDYAVSTYHHVLNGVALRLAERELAQKMALRTIDNPAGALSFHPLTSVISAAPSQPRHKTN